MPRVRVSISTKFDFIWGFEAFKILFFPSLCIYSTANKMETLAPLLHAFYSQPLSKEDRKNIHDTLLQSLTDSTYQTGAITYISHLVSDDSTEVDAYLLHHALHTIDTLARSSFSSIPQTDLQSLQSLLLNLLTCSQLRQQPIPSHALNKAAAVLVALGKRHWLAVTATSLSTEDVLFPNGLLKLINSPAHTSTSLASLLAGHALLTTFLDDALSSKRRDLLAIDSQRLGRLVSSHATSFLSALEITQRAAGPSVPSSVAPSAARAIASLARLQPSIASDA